MSTILETLLIFPQFLQSIIKSYGDWGQYQIFVVILFAEFLILVSIMILNLLTSAIRDIKARKKQKQRIFIHRRIHQFIFNNTEMPFPFFGNQTPNLYNLVPILDRLDTNVQSERWSQIKSHICLSDIRETARSWVQSKNWQKQNLGLRFLNFFILPEDEIYFLNCLKSTLPLVRMQAVEGLVKLNSKPGITEIITMASQELGFSGFAYLDTLIQGNLNCYKIVTQIYQDSSDPNIRIACLKVIQNKISSNFLKELQKDIASNNLELIEMAIKALGQIPMPQSLIILKTLVNHSEWRIRSQAISNLGKLKDYKSIPLLLKAQCDSHYFVRLNASIALLGLGESGRKALKLIDKDMDRYAFETSQYVLSFNAGMR